MPQDALWSDAADQDALRFGAAVPEQPALALYSGSGGRVRLVGGSPLAGSTKGGSSEGCNCGFWVGIRQHHRMVLGSHVRLHAPPYHDTPSMAPERGPPVQQLQGAHHSQMPRRVSTILGALALYY